MANKKGGGIGSRQHVSTPVREGRPRHGKNVRAVGQIGSSMGNHATEGGGKTLHKAVERMEGGRGTPSQLGNSVALNVGAGGPGKGRQVYASGSQSGMTTREIPKGHDILASFGPDMGGALGGRRR